MDARIPPKPESVSVVWHGPFSAILCPFDPFATRAILAAMLAELPGRTWSETELHLVDDLAIAELNAARLGCKGPTNILTFPGDHALPASLVLSTMCLRRESLLYGQSPAVHFLRLLAHGCGHLAGLDHGREMSLLEARCLEAAKHITEVGNERHQDILR